MKRKAKERVWLAALMLVSISFLSTGCLGRSPSVHHYVLGETASSKPSARAPEVSVAVGPVHLPAYLERSQIAALRSGGEVALDETNRWLGGFEENFLRALSLGLARELGSDRIVSHPTKAPFKLDYRVRLHVDDMIQSGTDGLRVRVRWSLVRNDGGGELALFVMDERVPANGTSAVAIVSAHDAALQTLVERIAHEIVRRETHSN